MLSRKIRQSSDGVSGQQKRRSVSFTLPVAVFDFTRSPVHVTCSVFYSRLISLMLIECGVRCAKFIFACISLPVRILFLISFGIFIVLCFLGISHSVLAVCRLCHRHECENENKRNITNYNAITF